MNRLIKFRLRIGSKIVGYEKFYPGHHRPNGLRDAEPGWLYSKEGDYWNPTFIHHDSKDEWSGLTDKNGKEIYEGDVLEEDAEWWQVQFIDRAMFEAIAINGGVSFALEEVAGTTTVQGNIYENSDLLNV